MTPEPKLTRWTAENSEVPGELRDLLRANRDQLGTQGEVQELRQSLSHALGPDAGLAGAAAIKAPSAAFRWGAWLAGGIVSGVVIWSVTRSTPTPNSTGQLHGVQMESPASNATDGAPPLTTPAPAAARAIAPGPELAPAVAEPPAPAEGTAQPGSLRPAKAAGSGLSEAELLQKAQALLAEDPARALALTREHERRFQRGALAQEREVIAIDALKRLGREPAARDRAAVFEKRYRGSVHQSRVRRPAAQD